MDRFTLEAALAPLLTELRGIHAELKKLSERPAPPMRGAPGPEVPYTSPPSPPSTAPICPVGGYICPACGMWVPFNVTHTCVRW